mgnify:CR=1 FL=1
MTSPTSIPNFLDALKEVIELEDTKRASAPYDYRHNPSSASIVSGNGEVVGSCMRQLYYKAKRTVESNPRDFTSRLQAMFGDGIHKVVLDKLQKSTKFTVMPEAAGKVTSDPLTKEISFRLDGLVSHEGQFGGLELKTMNSFGLQRMVKDGIPKESHLLQVISYFGTNPAIKWFALVYLGRDTAFRAEYHMVREENGDYSVTPIFPSGRKVILDGYGFENIKSRWLQLEKAVSANEVPRREYKVVFNDDGEIVSKRVKKGIEYKSDWQCSWCSYLTTCWSGPDAVKDSVTVIK